MPYRREIARKAKSVISENLEKFLLTGELASQDAEVFHLSGSRERLGLVWEAVEKEILRTWIKNNPCTRPYAFWQCASEKRKKISGSGNGWNPGMAVDSEGLPGYWQPHWKKKDPPVFESQAAYLERLSFLTSTEQKYLEKHHNLLKPDEIEFEK